MELRQIKYFLNLAATLSFTRAAELSNVSQPALTKAVRRLEDELGGPLVYRSGKDTRLTELGRTIRGDFEAIVKAETRARDLADLVIREERTMISIGVTSTIGPDPTMPFLASFLKGESGLETLISAIQPAMAHELLLSGGLDACFCTGMAPNNAKVLSVPLYKERLMLAVGATHQLAELDTVQVAALREEVYIDRINCEFRSAVIDHFMDKNVVVAPHLQSDREDWVQSAVASGLGIAMLPERSCTTSEIVLRPVTGLDLSREVRLQTVFGAATPPATRRLRDAAKQYNWQESNT